MKKKQNLLIFPLLLMGVFLVFANSCKNDDDNNDNQPVYGSFTDARDGNVYTTVVIGNQCWMAENLKASRFRNGELIPHLTDDAEWVNAGVSGDAAYCAYDNNTANANIYGNLYNWHAVNDSRGLAPEGWHVASDSEWEVMIKSLGGSGEGGKLKEAGTLHWKSPNTGADNSSGFTALPSGFRGTDFSKIGESCNFWTATQWDDETAYGRSVQYLSAGTGKSPHGMIFGFSVRCVRD